MQWNSEGREQGAKGKAGVWNPKDGRIVTDDFVHFVVHFAAHTRGGRCDMCMDDRPIRYS